MDTTITSELVEAHSVCCRKAFLMLRGDPQQAPHDLCRVIADRAAVVRRAYLATLDQNELPSNLRKLIVERAQGGLALSAGDLRADCDALVPVSRGAASGHYEPHVVTGTVAITQEQRLRLAFAVHFLAENGIRCSKYGIIIAFNTSSHRIRLQPLYPEVTATVEILRGWSVRLPADPPPLVLTKHCLTCFFHHLCHKEAEKQDNLSLLERMTPKVMQKYRKKGISTIEQLSYAYRPRRRRKRRANAPTVFNIELQALALRMNKVYLHEKPTLPKHSVELFIDIEGLTEEGFDYLIGLDVREGTRVTKHSFWADSADEEVGIFRKCLDVVAKYSDAPIFHYGSYERRAFSRVAKKHGVKCDWFIKRLVNVNSAIFGKVYFPARSNRLKDLGAFVGVTWRVPDASGLQSIAWRWRWDDTHEKKCKDFLIDYNHTDCEALRRLVDRLRDLGQDAGLCSEADVLDPARPPSTDTGKDIHRAFDDILRSAYEEYKGKRILIGQSLVEGNDTQPHLAHPLRHGSRGHIPPRKANRVKLVQPKRTCPYDGSTLSRSKRTAARFITDLEFTQHGCRRLVHKYVGNLAWCPKCKRVYNPPGITHLKQRFIGTHLDAWICYLRVILRLPYRVITQMIEEVFGTHVTASMHNAIIERVALSYAGTDRSLLVSIVHSPFVHVDETQVNICGANQYVWVLTNSREVVFRLTETRETTLMKSLLSGFQGILVSDFYGGYDSVECRQQKCFSHLIGDLNDDLWKNPYNRELESFVGHVKDLLVPIFQAVNRFGLKAYHLKRFVSSVDRFFERHVVTASYACEITDKYRKRFIRYRESLFRFLVEDGIPWNNNSAERALRHLAVQRKISGSFGERSLPHYLRLLGIAQTCRFQEKSFLKFLLSGEKDVESFKRRRRRNLAKLGQRKGDITHY